MPQFSLKRLLASTALFAVGFGLTIYVINRIPAPGVTLVIVWHLAGAFIGAAVFNIFRLAAVGAIVGAAVYFLVVASNSSLP